jgi:2-iminobutanoate/2-iminopropanoate deaminase
LYLSGQLGIDPETGEFAEGGFDAQARQALENLKSVLETAGFEMKDVVQCQVFVKDLDHYKWFNGIYQGYFNGVYPARAVLEVSRIPKDGLIEIMMVAVKTD